MKPSAYKITSGPAFWPINLSDLKHHCRIEESFTDDDAYLQNIIRSATLACEKFTEMQIGEAVIEAYLSEFPGVDDEYTIELIKYPIQNITKIEYFDTNNEKQTLSSAYYDVFVENAPPIIRKASSISWPSVYNKPKSIIITFKAGYSSIENVPADLVQGIMMFALHLYENRQDVAAGVSFSELPLASRHLWFPYCLKLLA